MKVHIRGRRQKALHLAFWVLLEAALLGWLLAFFVPSSALWISGGLVVLLAPAVYTNAFVLIPRFFNRHGAAWYIVLVIGTFATIPALWYSLSEWGLVSLHSKIQIYFVEDGVVRAVRSPARSRIGISVVVMVLGLFISTVYGLALRLRERERREAALERERLAQELKFLRTQINPHFLFNALNNLYATVQLQPQQTGEFILKLADMLRYVIYECRKDQVLLHQEVAYLRDYIFFEQQKNPLQHKLTVDLPAVSEDVTIEPMLLLPFVENSFKHSYWHDLEDSWIDIRGRLQGNHLHFEVRNSVPPSEKHTTEAPDRRGVGIKNVMRRLDLSYPNRHQLAIHQTETTFHVSLELPVHATANGNHTVSHRR